MQHRSPLTSLAVRLKKGGYPTPPGQSSDQAGVTSDEDMMGRNPELCCIQYCCPAQSFAQVQSERPPEVLALTQREKYNTQVQLSSRRLNTSFVTLFRLMCSAEMGRKQQVTLLENFSGPGALDWSRLLKKVIYFGMDTSCSVSGKPGLLGINTDIAWMHTIH